MGIRDKNLNPLACTHPERDTEGPIDRRYRQQPQAEGRGRPAGKPAWRPVPASALRTRKSPFPRKAARRAAPITDRAPSARLH